MPVIAGSMLQVLPLLGLVLFGDPQVARRFYRENFGWSEAGLFEPGLVGREQVPVGEVVEHAPGLPEPVGHVAGH